MKTHLIKKKKKNKIKENHLKPDQAGLFGGFRGVWGHFSAFNQFKLV